MSRPDHICSLIANKLSAEGVHWHETAKGVAALRETCAPNRLISIYLLQRAAEELSEQINSPRGNGYDLDMGTIRDAHETVREANAFINSMTHDPEVSK